MKWLRGIIFEAVSRSQRMLRVAFDSLIFKNRSDVCLSSSPASVAHKLQSPLTVLFEILDRTSLELQCWNFSSTRSGSRIKFGFYLWWITVSMELTRGLFVMMIACRIFKTKEIEFPPSARWKYSFRISNITRYVLQPQSWSTSFEDN